jgi:hypothetical protein
MMNTKSLHSVFSKIGNRALVKTNDAATTIKKVAKNTGAYALAPLGVGVGVGGGIYATSVGVDASVDKLTETKVKQKEKMGLQGVALIKLIATGGVVYLIYKYINKK